MAQYKANHIDSTYDETTQGGEPAPFWLITGTQEFAMIEACDRLRQRLRTDGFTDRQVLEMGANSDWSQLSMAAADVGMFADKKILEVRIPSAKPGLKGAKALEAFLSHPLSGVVTIFYIPLSTDDWATEKTAWWKNTTKACHVVKADVVGRRELPKWLAERMARHNQSATKEALEYFADLVEGNLMAAAQEVEKLALYAPEGELTRDDIEKGVVNNARFDYSTFTDALHAGDAVRVSRIIDGLQAQEEPLPIVVGILTSEINKLILLRSGMDQGNAYPKGVYATDAMRRAARRLSLNKLKNAYIICGEIDKISKGLVVKNRDTDPWIEIKSVALFLAS